LHTLTIPNVETGSISDGYHTFDELYEHRCLLFLNLCLARPEKVCWSRKNREGQSWHGWVILTLQTEAGQISYHVPDSYTEYFSGFTQLAENTIYDGHTSQDVVARLKMLAH